VLATSQKEQFDTILPEEEGGEPFHISCVGNTQGECTRYKDGQRIHWEALAT